MPAGLCSLVALAASWAHGFSQRPSIENRHGRCRRARARAPRYFFATCRRDAANARRFTDDDVADVVKLAMAGLVHQPAA